MSEQGHFQLPIERRHPNGRHPQAPGPVPYIASDELIEAVNLAIFLNRPLVLEGEAGSGKSQLAHHVAHSLGLPFHPWAVRSTSRAQDGLYSYDAILRLHDVHLAQTSSPALAGGRDRRWAWSGFLGWPRTSSPAPTGGRDPREPMHYVSYGALGRAFQLEDCPAVVLIDEIDKADIDFPNDLLTVLDEPREFVIREADVAPVRARHPPIVIVTSNKEKGNLPAPFLRRCIYYYVSFPSEPKRLKEILAAHGVAGADRGELQEGEAGLVNAALERFVDLRSRDDLFKKPGTSELLDWLKALARDAAQAGDAVQSLVAGLKDKAVRLPHPELLFKLRADWQRYALGH